jgi:hypothetical protein
MSFSGWFLSGVMSFFALLKTRSHSVDITGQDRVSRAYLKERREVVFTRYSSPASNSIKTVTTLIRSAAGVLLGLGLRRIVCLLPVSKGELLLLW